VRAVLCLVTNRARYGGESRLVDAVGEAAAAGVHLVHVRERDLEAKALYMLVRRCVAAVERTRTRILVNDRFDVAVAAGAHGVHLPSFGVPAPRIRAVAPPGFLIGRSVHAVEEATAIGRDGGVDFLVFGTVFATTSKPGAQPAGADALRVVADSVAIPVLAIGGITTTRLRLVASTGAAGFAAIDLFAEAATRGLGALQTLVSAAALAFDTPSDVP
jgi:thiamine-phosphate pyrophosphorylase